MLESIFNILIQWAWFSMSTRNLIGFGQNQANYYQTIDGQPILRQRIACAMKAHVKNALKLRDNTAHRMPRLYANALYAA